MTKPVPGASRPARPHHRLTDEGLRVREVLSYARRGARLTERQRRAWETHSSRLVVPEDVADRPDFRLHDVFDRGAPLVLEVGSGIGEATTAYAAAHPAVDVVALEVWRPGMAELLHRVAEAGLDNVRVLGLDAVWVLDHLVLDGSVSELWTFFPDPWPKTKHHKRRLVSPSFARRVAEVLAPGGTWRLATDWPDYATWMVDVLDGEPGLSGGPVERWPERPVTKFERRGLADERPVVDLAYTARR